MQKPRTAAAALGALALVAGTAGVVSSTAASAAPTSGEARSVLVLASSSASDAQVRRAISAAGGRVTDVNKAIGLYTVETSSDAFNAAVSATAAVDSVGRDKVVGYDDPAKAKNKDKVEKENWGQSKKQTFPAPNTTGEPLASRQWDMRMMNTAQAHTIETGRGVRVGIMDTGVDGNHPDIKPNFNFTLSRNFTTDIESIDGACADEPDQSCSDPADVDENGHGTHVASTIASPVNGQGIAGVAPNAEIVNLRAGQDSGYFFLKATVDALTYAPSAGVDVVNMSYYIDPWMYNCRANPADSPAEQAEQSLVIDATNRALKYAHRQGVTLVAAAGNDHQDLDNKVSDDTSPDFPEGNERVRAIDSSCLDMPAEGYRVNTVSSIGPSGRKAYYSNYGTGIDISAPGGDSRDFPGTDQYRSPGNLILAAYPKNVGIEEGAIDPVTGDITPGNEGFVVKDGEGYYQAIQGTSMASPHAAGVAALIVGRWGHKDPKNGGLTLNASQTDKILAATAKDTPCPAGGTQVYPLLPDVYTATCTGTTAKNTFYGDGIVDAYKAVTSKNGK